MYTTESRPPPGQPKPLLKPPAGGRGVGPQRFQPLLRPWSSKLGRWPLGGPSFPSWKGSLGGPRFPAGLPLETEEEAASLAASPRSLRRSPPRSSAPFPIGGQAPAFQPPASLQGGGATPPHRDPGPPPTSWLATPALWSPTCCVPGPRAAASCPQPPRTPPPHP